MPLRGGTGRSVANPSSVECSDSSFRMNHADDLSLLTLLCQC